MKKHHIPHQQTGYFSQFITDYLNNASNTQPFIKYPFQLEAIETMLPKIKAQGYPRAIVAATFQRQYQHIKATPFDAVQQNISALTQPNTFTVVTGHQTNLFTGPLYFFYKIISAINLAEQLNKTHPNEHFVPVYWMGSEDHDFEEINHTYIFGQKITWEQAQKGATGRLATQTLAPVLEQLKTLLGDGKNATTLLQLLEKAYLEQNTLGNATQYLVNELFGQYGLLVLDQDDNALKQHFTPIIQEELTHFHSHTLVQQTNQALIKSGYPTQAYTRPINFFYLTDDFRQRIEFDEKTQTYAVVNTALKFSQAELAQTIKQFPERFSPNVILRPLYQQSLLPCVAYVGGGGELAYWMQLKKVFTHYKVHYPMLVLRNSVLWIDRNSAKKIDKLALSIPDLFKDKTDLIAQYVQKNTQQTLDLTSEKEQLQAILTLILEKAKAIDATLEQSAKGEIVKMTKSIATLENKLLRAEKRKFDTSIQQINGLIDRLFPQNSLQERKDNFIPFYLKYGADFIALLKKELQPFEKTFLVLIE